MIVVAHPDDEILGLGGSMHKLIYKFNIQTQVIILGEGITSRDENRSIEKWKSELNNLKKCTNSAKKIIGYQEVNFYEFPDNRFDSIDLLDIIKVIEKEIEVFRPNIIFTHHGGDLNIDHQKTFEAVITACRPIVNEDAKTIITFETPSSTEWQSPYNSQPFLPNLFFSIDKDNLEAKIKAMELYTSEKKKYPHPRSPEALEARAKIWGTTVGCIYAEPFQIIRTIF
ncbi:MAG: PIG-L family deacetylase [Chitinophagales bacterium]|nr:PIG-L family deacetylase [Chitinophagales bacterium]